MWGDVRYLPMPASCWGWLWYSLWVLFLALLIRLGLSAMRASERCGLMRRGFSPGTIWMYFRGFGFGEVDKPERGGNDDYLQPLFLGFLELFIYPMLLAANLPVFIGAWIGLKTLPQLETWSKVRPPYQRFLIGNTLVLVFSYVLMKCFLSRWESFPGVS